MGETPDELKDRTDETRVELAKDVDRLMDKVSPARITQRRVDSMRRSAGTMKNRVMGSLGGLAAGTGQSVGGAASSLTGTAQEVPHRLRSQAEGNPIAAGIIAFGLGALAAALLPSTDVEGKFQQQLAEVGVDPVEAVKEAASESAHQLKEGLQDPAQQAVAAVKDTAQGAVQQTQAAAQQAAAEVTEHGQAAVAGLREPEENSF